ncbi:hypothetical protein Nepgr_006509 [Nepenthes gracilis]|uniref:Uncharacterized protein n=1 Tax=Nepenthes gracilis TaxID=150966 RepID=A0AAD3S553_NEPGR|nr:hypothetical protein Nepgr_006509 [Nepenthes gracilis]
MRPWPWRRRTGNRDLLNRPSGGLRRILFRQLCRKALRLSRHSYSRLLYQLGANANHFLGLSCGWHLRRLLRLANNRLLR